jgi:hypothetical protein
MDENSDSDEHVGAFTMGPTKGNQNGDWALVDLVMLCALGNEMGITLTVGGTVISGQLISAEKYFSEMAELISDAETGGSGSSTVNALEYAWTAFAKLHGRPDDVENWSPPIDGFIHLRGAQIRSSHGGFPDRPGMLWRGRMTDVSGWALGTLNSVT